jgi:DNA-directed RNA polymerase specialized sigma24 family protein
MARDVAHGVARPAAPLAAYLLGLAAGLTGDPEAAADELAQRICLLAQRWADEQSG